MNMKKVLLLSLVFVLMISAQAQQQFTNFASKNTITSVADDGTKMWIGTSGGLYVRSKSTGAIMLTYTIDNGLPSSFVNDVVVDPFGNVWVATRKGLAKFNGSTWTTYNQSSGLPNNLINGITIDQSGSIWVYSFWGYLSKLESNDTWTNYDHSAGFPSEQPRCIATGPDGNLWIGTQGGGAYDFNINTHVFTQHMGHFGTYDRVYDIIVDASSNLWFASYSGLAKFDGGSTWNLYTTADGLASDNSKALTSDADGNIWVASYASGITKFDPTGVATQIYDESNGLGHNYTNAIAVDSDGKVWVGTRYGLSRYNVAGNSWNVYIVNNTLSNNEVMDVKTDASNNVWIGTEYGLNKYNGTTWTNWFETDGLIQDRVACLDVRGTDIWMGADFGLTHFDGANFTTYGFGNGITHVEDVLINIDGSVWAATSTGLVHFDGVITTLYTTTEGLVNNNCLSLAKDGTGNLWIGTMGGVSKWNGSSFTNYTTADGLSQNYTHAITIAANGNIWAMCQGQVSVFNGTNWSAIGFNTTYDMAQSSDGKYWLANYWGIKKYDGTNTATYTSADGLADDAIYDVAIAADGTKWFGTRAGLVKAICDNPIPSFTTNTACLPGVTTFTNTSSLVDATTTYEWDINNDGSIEYTSFEPTHTFSSEGTVAVKLTATNDECSDVIIQNVTTYNTPIVELNPSNNFSICSGSSANIQVIGTPELSTILTEDFNYADLAASGWTNEGDATTNWSINASSNAGGTSPELMMSYNPSYDGYGFVASPVMDMSAYGELNLSFKYAIYDYAGAYTIGVKTTSDGVNWNTVWSQAITTGIAATTESISISNSDIGSATFQIAFYLEGDSYNIDYWYIDDITISAASPGVLNPAYTYAWSTGATGTSINVSAANTYSVTATNGSCTYQPTSVTMSLLEPFSPTICMVMVDTSVNRNLVVWEKPTTGSISSFNIYKEITTDNYEIVGSKLYSEISEFIDYTSTPDVHADKYKISAVDTCGNESALSPFHQTMNLSQAQGSQSNELVLLWNKYIDESAVFTPTSYLVYRGVDPNNMTLASTLTGGLSSYNYNALSVVNNEKFIVVIDMPTCTPTSGAKATGGPYYQSTSNMEDEGIINTGIVLNLDYQISIYPNPVNEKTIIKSDKQINTIRIVNLTGETVRLFNNINAFEFEILRENIASGAYFIEINNTFQSKIIFE